MVTLCLLNSIHFIADPYPFGFYRVNTNTFITRMFNLFSLLTSVTWIVSHSVPSLFCYSFPCILCVLFVLNHGDNASSADLVMSSRYTCGIVNARKSFAILPRLSPLSRPSPNPLITSPLTCSISLTLKCKFHVI